MTVRNTASTFWSRVNKNGPKQPHMRSRCWVWTGKTFRGGYGKFQFAGKSRVASRVAWFLKTGRWPVGALHRCDVPGCVRFSHLFDGDAGDNARDSAAKGRRPDIRGNLNPSRRYPDRVPRGEGVHGAKFTAKTVMDVRQLYATGKFTQTTLAKKFKISRSHLCGLLHRKFWRHV